MDPRLPQPVSREQIVAIIRQRAERNLDQAIAPRAPPPNPPVAQAPRIGILPPPPPPPPMQEQQPEVIMPRGIIAVDHMIRPSTPPSPSPPAAAGGGIGVYSRLHDVGGHHVRRNEQILKHHPLYRQVSVTSSASDEEHCISAYSDPLEDAPRIPYVEENTCPLGRGSEKVSGDMMLVDGGEEDWLRLHDIRLNGQILEYTGRGKSLIDVGLAQAKNPITTRHHYFEIEIVDPGVSCYIAIGLARRDYPRNRHPGWNKGSIAYHADDGKVFVGSGVGGHFGPRCTKGDVMGCGVLFPKGYQCKSDSDEELEQQSKTHHIVNLETGVVGPATRSNEKEVTEAVFSAGSRQPGRDYVECEERDVDLPSEEGADDLLSDSEEDWWTDHARRESGVKVQIFFTRNSKFIGKKDTTIPRGGFYPTVGMMSCKERVRVDLRPLSG